MTAFLNHNKIFLKRLYKLILCIRDTWLDDRPEETTLGVEAPLAEPLTGFLFLRGESVGVRMEPKMTIGDDADTASSSFSRSWTTKTRA